MSWPPKNKCQYRKRVRDQLGTVTGEFHQGNWIDQKKFKRPWGRAKGDVETSSAWVEFGGGKSKWCLDSFVLRILKEGATNAERPAQSNNSNKRRRKKFSILISVVDSKRRPLYLIVRFCRNCLANPRRYLMYEEVSLIFMFY